MNRCMQLHANTNCHLTRIDHLVALASITAAVQKLRDLNKFTSGIPLYSMHPWTSWFKGPPLSTSRPRHVKLIYQLYIVLLPRYYGMPTATPEVFYLTFYFVCD